MSKPDVETPIATLFEQHYRRERLSRGDQQATEIQYRIQIAHFERWHRGRCEAGEAERPVATLGDLTGPRLRECMIDMIERGATIATANKVRRHLVALHNFAREEYEAAQLPLVCKAFKEPETLPNAWSLEEMGQLLLDAEKASGRVGGVPTRVFLPALLGVLFKTGLRIRATTKIATGNFATGDGVASLSVDAGTQKQRREQRFSLRGRVVDDVLALRSRERGLDRLFGDWRHKRPPATMLKNLIFAAGLADDFSKSTHGRWEKSFRRHLFHKIRRTTATHTLAAGASLDEVRQLLGHASAATTLRYIDPRYVPSMDAAKLVPEVPHYDRGEVDNSARRAKLRLYNG